MHFLIVNLNNIFRKYPRFSGSPKMTHFQIRKTSFGSFSAVPTNFKILQILRNAGRPPASNSIESRSVWPRKRRKPQLSKISKSPAANPSPYPLPLTLTPWNRKEWRMKNEEWEPNAPPTKLKIGQVTQKNPTKWSPKAVFDTSRFRRVMIRTSLLRITIRSRIKNFANFDRPKKGRINEFLNSFFEIGYSSTRSCQHWRQKPKVQRNFIKKVRLKIAKSYNKCFISRAGTSAANS